MKHYVINEEFLQQLETLQTIISNNVAGRFGGNRLSKNFGSSCEFTDYRDYIAGDDIMKIDWNAYARFEKLYMKLYRDERQMHTKIYIDASYSMVHGDGKKAEQAIRIAAAFAYLAIKDMDRLSVYVIKDKEIHEVISNIIGKDSYINSIGKLNDIVFEGDSYISDAILPANVGYGDGMSIIISDFLTDNDFEKAIDKLIEKRRDVFCVQILSEEEVNPIVRGKMHLLDAECDERFYRKHIDREIMKAYREALAYVKERIGGYCTSRGAGYVFCHAEEKLSELFLGKLTDMGVLK